MPDPPPEEIQTALRGSAGRRGPFGARVLFFHETASTNDVAATLAESGAAHGTTVVAAAQTAGRGRMGRQWFSPPGAGLYVSVVCRSRPAAPLITLAGGVAVAEGIRGATGLPVTIKWPNDIVITDPVPRTRRKLAGILAEGSTGADGLQHVVLGFGINLRPAAFPPGLAGYATSLETELGRPVDAGVVLSETLAALHRTVTQLEAGGARDVLERWRALAPASLGAAVQWTVNGVTHRGTTAGIDERGALCVRTADATERIIAGELTWL